MKLLWIDDMMTRDDVLMTKKIENLKIAQNCTKTVEYDI